LHTTHKYKIDTSVRANYWKFFEEKIEHTYKPLSWKPCNVIVCINHTRETDDFVSRMILSGIILANRSTYPHKTKRILSKYDRWKFIFQFIFIIIMFTCKSLSFKTVCLMEKIQFYSWLVWLYSTLDFENNFHEFYVLTHKKIQGNTIIIRDSQDVVIMYGNVILKISR
jgi:hypothetical protein